MAAAPGALAVLLGVAHLVVAGRRILAGEGRPSDLFVVVGLAVVLISAPDDLMISPSPDLPAAAVEQDLHAARASTDGLIRRTAARKTRSLGPMPEIDSRSGANSNPASSLTSSGSPARAGSRK